MISNWLYEHDIYSLDVAEKFKVELVDSVLQKAYMSYKLVP